MRLKADFHIHTRDDPQGVQRHSAEELILKAEKLGYSVLAITNKKTVTYSEELASFAKEHGILLIPGMETMVSGKEVLILNYQGKPPETFKELSELRSEHPEMLCIAPHPYFVKKKCLKDNLYRYPQLFDAIEYSHFHLSFFNPNKRGVKAAKDLGKPMVATSDAHHIEHFGEHFTWVSTCEDPTIDDVVEAIRNAQVEIESAPINLRRFVTTAATVLTVRLNTPLRKKLREWDDSKKKLEER